MGGEGKDARIASFKSCHEGERARHHLSVIVNELYFLLNSGHFMLAHVSFLSNQGIIKANH